MTECVPCASAAEEGCGTTTTYRRGCREQPCRDAHAADARQWRNANPNKEKPNYAKSTRAWKKRYPERDQANQAVHHAIDRGDLVRPDICEHCGRSDLPIEASHTDYSRQLDVEWLCRPCHQIKDGIK